MMNTPSNDPSPETIIRDLHLAREAIVNSFGGNLHALTTDARQRQEQSGRSIWRRKTSNKVLRPTDGDSLASDGQSTPVAG